MTHEQYHAFAELFDAVLAVERAAPNLGLQLHGQIAAQALLTWAKSNNLDAALRTLGREADGQRLTWTAVVIETPAITVHLEDEIAAPEAA